MPATPLVAAAALRERGRSDGLDAAVASYLIDRGVRNPVRVTDPDDVQVAFDHPVPAPEHAALLASYELVLRLTDSLLPVKVPGAPGRFFFEDWETTRAALIARMASTLRHLGYLAPSSSRLDGIALARTLLEHAISFAWISANPRAHLPRFLRTNFSRALTTDKKFRANDDALIDEDLRQRYRCYVRAHTDDMPGLPRRAEEADERWLSEARALMPDPLQLPALVELYDIVYDSFANLDHPSITALQIFVRTDPVRAGAVVDGEPNRERETDVRPYWLGLWSFVWALAVSTCATRRPLATDLQRAVSRARALREFDRHGLLDVSQRGDTITVGLTADADAHIAETAVRRDPEPN